MPVRKKLKANVQEDDTEEFLTVTVPLRGYVLEDVTHLILHEPPTVNQGYRVPSPQKNTEKENQDKDDEYVNKDFMEVEGRKATIQTPESNGKSATDTNDGIMCEVCNKTFNTPYSLRRHTLEAHPASPLCDDCADSLRKPMPSRALQSSFNCSRCGKHQFVATEPKESDTTSLSKRKRLPWGNSCPFCEKTLSHHFNVKRHIIEVHKIALSELDSAIDLWRKENYSTFNFNKLESSKTIGWKSNTPSNKVPALEEPNEVKKPSTAEVEEIDLSDSEEEDFDNSLQRVGSNARKSFPLSKTKEDKGNNVTRKSVPAKSHFSTSSKNSSLKNVELPIPEIIIDPKRPNVTCYVCSFCRKHYADINKHLNRFHRVTGYKNWELIGTMPPQKNTSSKVSDKCPYCSVPVIKLDVHLSNFHKDELLKEKDEDQKEKEEMYSSSEDFDTGNEQLPKFRSKMPSVSLKNSKGRGRPKGTFKTDSKYKRMMQQRYAEEEEEPDDSMLKDTKGKPTDTLFLTPRILKKDLPNFAITEEIANDPILRDLFPFPCALCNKTFKDNSRLQKHLKTHSK